ncbi:tonB-dependent receptor family protein [Asticcacaulis biprosthecium C19]|uniref:TonB-dependent receptor family protein n=1 Tax=Asticcacaulis biprosthecium C19 TaxID=715226 RepID=F4QU85_9CAUL|nr:TonB-dependent receptor [Asticcacaulis biprosthecium]EGF89385.1 tonB-dependent receptor family protein [Asticcacaulis biprosthecium C19]
MKKGTSFNRKNFRYALLGATILAGAAGAAYAQDAAPPAGDVVVVTGFKRSAADAIRAKKQNIEISDGISSDGLGRFPDLNVGEALQRIPGVQINREAEGRNATIGLRGMPGYYARTTLNGQAFAEPPYVTTTGGADGTPLGAFNSDIFTAFSIQKSPMANSQSGGLSGNIDMQISPALSRKDGGFAKAAYEYNTNGGLGAPAYTIGYNKHINSDFAVFGTFAYRKENFRRDTLRYNGYNRITLAQSKLTAQQFADAYGAYYGTTASSSTFTLAQALGNNVYTAPSNVGSASQNGIWALGLMRQYTRMNVGTLQSGSAGAEWRVNDNLKIGVTAYHSDRDLPDTVQYFLLNDPFGTATVEPLTSPVVMENGFAVVPRTRNSNYDGKTSTRLFSQKQAADGVFLNAEWENDKWRFAGVIAATTSSNSSEETELDLRTVTLGGSGNNGLVEIMDTGLGELGDFYQSVTPTPQNVMFTLPFRASTSTAGFQPGYWNWAPNAPTDLFTSDGKYLLHLGGTHRYATKSVNSVQFDAERQVEFGPITSIQGGIRSEGNEYESRGVRNMAYGIQTQNITASMLIKAPSVDDFMEGKAPINTDWLTIDPIPFLNAIRPVTKYGNGELSDLGFNVFYADGGFANNNFKVTNDLMQAYIQAKYDTSIFGHRVRGNVGVRSETTEYEVTTLDRTARVASNGGVGARSDFTWHTYKDSYSQILPSAIAVADVFENVVLRAAYYKTYVRPDPQTSSPVRNYSYSTNNESTLTQTITNVNINLASGQLKPYLADNYDLSLEWYNRPNGLISLAYFKKKLTNRVAAIADPALLCPADGSDWGFGALTWNGSYCSATNANDVVNGVPNSYRIFASGLQNIDSPTYVSGLEFNIQQNFDFLPSFWKNFGGSFNYAFTQAKQTGGSKTPFPGISKHNYNAILYYETSKYGIRAVYNWRSEYNLDGSGTFFGNARNAAARGQLDLSASYNINERVSISLDAYNLTNSFRKEYQGDERMVRQIDYDGQTFTASVKASF